MNKTKIKGYSSRDANNKMNFHLININKDIHL